MSRLNDKSKLLQILSETPIVTFACKKVGLNPCTFYRWHKSDKKFREKADEYLSIGRMTINDMAESGIIKGIKDGNMRAIVFWSQHNNPRYRPVRTTYVDPISPHAHELVPGEICKSCGYMEPKIEEYKVNKNNPVTNEQLSKELYKRLRSVNTRKQSEGELRTIIDKFIEDNNIKFEMVIVEGNKNNNEEIEDENKTKDTP
jgi:hypothetical protein